MLILLSYIGVALIVWYVQDARYKVIRDVDLERNDPAHATAWRDFIISNINSCITTDQCFQVYELIKLFKERFKNEMPRDFFNEWVESLINRVDTKYKSLKSEEEQMSELTIDRLVN